MGKHKSRQIHEQQHGLAGEEEEEEDCLAGAHEIAAPPGRRSTRGERRGSPGNTNNAPAAKLTSSTAPLREWSVEGRRRTEREEGG